MAIDSAEKRKASSGAFAIFNAPSVTPNSSKDAEWRQQALWSYSGIAADAPTPDVQAGFKLALNAPAPMHFQQGHYFRFKHWRPAYGG